MDIQISRGRKSRRAGHDDGYSTVAHPFGYELSGVGEAWQGPLFLGVFAAIWVIATAFVLVVVRREASGVFLIVALVAGATWLLLLWVLGRALVVRVKWESSRLILEQWPLAIGDSTVMWFGRPLAKSTNTPRPHRAELILRESATYQVGTDTRTATSDLRKIPLSLTDRSIDGIEGFETELSIPTDGPPTIQLDSNLVEWIVEFDLDAPKAPAATSKFTILVAPELASTS